MIEQISDEKCNGCGWCVMSCRMELIHVDRRKRKAFFKDPEQCVVCYACVRTCPQDAILVGAEKPAPFPRPVFQSELHGDLSTLAQGKVSRKEVIDVAVVGAGVTGLTAAISAAKMGAGVIVFEKAPDIRWTNTSLSGGSISFAKEREMYPEAGRLSAAEKVQQARELIGEYANAGLIKTWCENIDETLNLLKKLGLKQGKEGGSNVPAVAAFDTRGKGHGLNKKLLSIAQKMGCRVRFNSRAVKLLTDSHGVSGVRVMTSEGLLDCISRGVILAAAGFQANPKMVEEHLGRNIVQNVKLTGSPFSTGDGHFLAGEVGARFTNMQTFHCRQLDKSWIPFSTGSVGPRQLQPFHHYGIFVNKLGKRFIDEYGPFVRSDSVSGSIIAQPDGEIAYVWDETIHKLMGKKAEKYSPAGIIVQADSMHALAEKIGYPPEVLGRTIEEYNAAIKAGEVKELDIPKSDFTFPLERPPFYAIAPVWPGLNCTFGGPAINERAEVLDNSGCPIPGLYAAGENAGGFFYGRFYTTPANATYYLGNYQVTSSSLGYCIVFGRIAGIQAALRRFDAESLKESKGRL